MSEEKMTPKRLEQIIASDMEPVECMLEMEKEIRRSWAEIERRKVWAKKLQERQEWVTCIKAPDAAPWTTICGREAFGEFIFVDAEHARLNKEQGGRLVTCSGCETVEEDQANDQT